MKSERQEINEALDARFGKVEVDTTYQHCLGGILDKKPKNPITYMGKTPDGKIWYLDGGVIKPTDVRMRKYVVQMGGRLMSSDEAEILLAGTHMGLPDLTRRYKVKSDTITIDIPDIRINANVGGFKVDITFKFTPRVFVRSEYRPKEVKAHIQDCVMDTLRKQTQIFNRAARRKILAIIAKKANLPKLAEVVKRSKSTTLGKFLSTDGPGYRDAIIRAGRTHTSALVAQHGANGQFIY